MASSIPCITTDVGDAKFIVSDTGWTVPVKNPELLADAILNAVFEMQENPIAWQIRRLSARDRIVNNFSIDSMVNAYNDVWLNKENKGL